MRLAMTTLVVPDYDEAVAFFTQALDFALEEDTDLGAGKRWIVVSGGGGAKLLIARAANSVQMAAIGKQAGGRVGWFVHTDDFAFSHSRLTAHGIAFDEAPREEIYGTVAVFTDPWGNRWDLIEDRKAA